MSDFTIYCPSCGHGLVATDDIVGQKAQCPDCEAHFIVPEPQLPAKAARPRFCVKSTAGMEAGIRHRLPFVTVALMSISILMMVCIISKTGQLEPDARLLVSWGASFRPLTFGGQFWRLITSAFVHFNIMHAAMNMLCLFSIGKTLETLVGHLKVAEIYFLTAITGGLFSCMFHADVICAGASGAVFGLFGAEIAYLTLLHEKLGLSSNKVVGNIKGGLVFVGINFAYSLLPGVDMAAHAGGLIGGIAIGATIALASKKGIEEVVNWSMSGLAILAVFVLAISLSTGRNAGRLDLANLKAEVSKMLADNLNKNCENGCSFEVTDIALMRGKGNRYNGDVEMSFKCGGNVYPMKSRIEVFHDAMETSCELNKEDFEKSLLRWQTFLHEDFIADPEIDDYALVASSNEQLRDIHGSSVYTADQLNKMNQALSSAAARTKMEQDFVKRATGTLDVQNFRKMLGDITAEKAATMQKMEDNIANFSEFSKTLRGGVKTEDDYRQAVTANAEKTYERRMRMLLGNKAARDVMEENRRAAYTHSGVFGSGDYDADVKNTAYANDLRVFNKLWNDLSDAERVSWNKEDADRAVAEAEAEYEKANPPKTAEEEAEHQKNNPQEDDTQ